jgi:chromosome segregation ATPase
MKFQVAKQLLRDVAKARIEVEAHQAKMQEVKRSGEQASAVLGSFEREIEAQNTRIREILSEIEQLNHKITSLHAERRQCEANSTQIHEKASSARSESDRVKDEWSKLTVRSLILDQKKLALEEKLPAAEAKIKTVQEKRTKEAHEAKEPPVIRVVHVGLDGLELKRPPVQEIFTAGKEIKRYVKVPPKD